MKVFEERENVNKCMYIYCDISEATPALVKDMVKGPADNIVEIGGRCVKASLDKKPNVWRKGWADILLREWLGIGIKVPGFDDWFPTKRLHARLCWNETKNNVRAPAPE